MPTRLIRSRLIIFAIVSFGTASFSGFSTMGCDSASQAGRDFYAAFKPKVEETRIQQNKDSKLVNNLMQFMYADVVIVSPGNTTTPAMPNKKFTQEEINNAIAAIDMAITELSVDPGMPVPPEDCQDCAGRNQAVLDTRNDAISSMRKAKAAARTSSSFIKIHQDEIAEINNVRSFLG